jgi:hypothetical protein
MDRILEINPTPLPPPFHQLFLARINLADLADRIIILLLLLSSSSKIDRYLLLLLLLLLLFKKDKESIHDKSVRGTLRVQ